MKYAVIRKERGLNLVTGLVEVFDAKDIPTARAIAQRKHGKSVRVMMESERNHLIDKTFAARVAS